MYYIYKRSTGRFIAKTNSAYALKCYSSKDYEVVIQS
jgi:hypothetical protein